jgi:hypothetical protein
MLASFDQMMPVSGQARLTRHLIDSLTHPTEDLVELTEPAHLRRGLTLTPDSPDMVCKTCEYVPILPLGLFQSNADRRSLARP